MPRTDDDVTIISADRALGGWTSVAIARGIERCPNSFEVTMSSEFSDTASETVGMLLPPGAPCEVRIGKDLLITGFVDRVMPRISTHAHTTRVVGRGRCADLVDCAAIWPGRQMGGANVYELALRLAEPYGIGVEGLGDMGPRVNAFNFAHGQRCWELIELYCRVAQVLAFETPEGNLRLLNAGAGVVPMLGAADLFRPAASGFAEGVNIMEAESMWSMDERYSEYRVFMQSLDVLADLGANGNLVGEFADPGVPRRRRLELVAENTSVPGLDVAKKRAQWEASRRWGRSGTIRLLTDSWRDSAGALYEPGTTAHVDAPSIFVAGSGANGRRSPNTSSGFVISEVVYRYDQVQGTSAEITLMPREAFAPAPTLPPYAVSPEILNQQRGPDRP
jgi:prophage tail gpP-like protein